MTSQTAAAQKTDAVGSYNQNLKVDYLSSLFISACGEMDDTSSATEAIDRIVNGIVAMKGDYPWQAGIVVGETRRLNYVCHINSRYPVFFCS